MYRNPVNDEHVVQFWFFVRKWQRILNLMDWEIADYTHTDHRDCDNKAVIFDVDLGNRQARISVGYDWGLDPITEASLEETAKHELLHLLLYGALAAAAESGDENDDAVSGPEHAVIRVLVPLLRG